MLRWVRDEAPDAFRRPVAVGVPYCLGTDAMHGLFAYEMETLAKWDIPEMDAIVAGTMSGAKALGIDDETGSLETGKLADVIAVDGDPLTDIQALGKVSFVMRAGRVYDPIALLDGAAN